MSGVFKAIGKVFKAVIKVVKKIAPIVLAVGAAVFTAGAALHLSFAAGGWGAAVSGLTSSLGLGSTLTNVLTGAIVQAGYGAAIGGVIGAATGKGFMKGAAGGALTGAITGGVTGLLAPEYIDPLKNVVGKGSPAASPGAAQGPSAAEGAQASSGPSTGLLHQNADAVNQATQQAGAPPGPIGGPIGADQAKQIAKDAVDAAKPGWFSRNSGLLAPAALAVGGAFQGAAQAGSADAARKQVVANYSQPGNGLLVGDQPFFDANQLPTPSDKYDHSLTYSFEYQWDPAQGKMVKVPKRQFA